MFILNVKRSGIRIVVYTKLLECFSEIERNKIFFNYRYETGYTVFPTTYVGGSIPRLTSYLRHLAHAASSFVGCMQDININGQWIFPLEKIENQTLENIEPGSFQINIH